MSAERNVDTTPPVITAPNVTQVGQFTVGKIAVDKKEEQPPAAPLAPKVADRPPQAADAPAPKPEIPPAEQGKLLRAAITDKCAGLKGADFKRYMMGWFHVATDKDLPGETEKYLAPLKKLLAYVEQATENAMQMADAANQKNLGARLTDIPAPAGPAAKTAAKPAASLKKLGWSEQTSALGAKVMAVREMTEADLFAYLKTLQIDPADDAEVAALLAISLHTREAFKVANEARRTGVTIAQWAAFIEKGLGVRLLDKECDSEKVQKYIEDALATAQQESQS